MVSEEDVWHFCYILPCLHPDDPIELAISTCLQMGWMESPPIFSTALQMAHDIGQEMLKCHHPLPPHQLEQLCLLDNITLKIPTSLPWTTSPNYLKYTMMTLWASSKPHHGQSPPLHPCHPAWYPHCFPPPGMGNDPNDEPISIKKLQQGDGIWATCKEVLGWIFGGITHCMQLPHEKVTKIKTQLKTILCNKHIHFGDIEKLNGKLMHATISIPKNQINHATHQAIMHWITLLPTTTKHPTPCHGLVPAPANLGGYCDTSKQGMDSIWFGLSMKLPPIVWWIKFPEDLLTVPSGVADQPSRQDHKFWPQNGKAPPTVDCSWAICWP